MDTTYLRSGRRPSTVWRTTISVTAAILLILPLAIATPGADGGTPVAPIGIGDDPVVSTDTSCLCAVELSTGVEDGQLLSIGDRDRDWRVVDTPSGSVDREAWVLDPAHSWAQPDEARWIGPHQDAGSSASTGWYTFEFTFEADSRGRGTLDLPVYTSDDHMEIYVNGNGPLNPDNGPFRHLKTFSLSANGIPYDQGENVIEVRLENLNGPTGFLIAGSFSFGDCRFQAHATPVEVSLDPPPGTQLDALRAESGPGVGSDAITAAHVQAPGVPADGRGIVLEAQTGAPTRAVSSAAQVSALGGLVTAEGLGSQVLVTLADGIATVDFTGSHVDRITVDGTVLPTDVPANTIVPLPGLGYAVIKEARTGVDGGTAEGVANMAHIFLTQGPVTGEVVIGQAYAGFSCNGGLGEVLEPASYGGVVGVYVPDG